MDTDANSMLDFQVGKGDLLGDPELLGFAYPAEWGWIIQVKDNGSQNLSNYEKIFAAAGHPHVVFGISFIALCTITKGIEYDITD